MEKIQLTLTLTDTEDQLCSLLVEFTDTLPQTVECYIAGGWVRDKILGLSSNDIDIALSSMMGVPFAQQFSSFLHSKNILCTRVTKVESRPQQSKHLETAKLGVLGLDLDFVNLRSEEYTSDSRIPVKVKFGTKCQDASRRDLTINALLYNVHTRSIEDPTFKGIEDIKGAKIRTPVEPKQTFLDDPLRVLRSIRFASRFSYALVPELAKAARGEEVQCAFNTIITRERIGDEISKMFKGPDPLHAVQLIHALSLYRSIFTPPPPFVPSESSSNYQTGLAAAVILHSLLFPQKSHLQWKTETVTPHSILLQHTLSSTSIQSRLFLASALTPFKDSHYYAQRSKRRPVVEACLRDALKLGVQDHFLDGIPVLFEGAKLVSEFISEKSPKSAEKEVDIVPESKPEKSKDSAKDLLSIKRVAMGLFFRQPCIHNPTLDAHWTSTILFSLVQELVPLWRPNDDREDQDLLDPSNVGFIGNGDPIPFNPNTGTLSPEPDTAAKIIERYNALIKRAEELDLIKAVDMPHLLNGHDLTTLLGWEPGPWVKSKLSKVMEWQLANPQGNRTECENWIKKKTAGEQRPSTPDGS